MNNELLANSIVTEITAIMKEETINQKEYYEIIRLYPHPDMDFYFYDCFKNNKLVIETDANKIVTDKLIIYTKSFNQCIRDHIHLFEKVRQLRVYIISGPRSELVVINKNVMPNLVRMSIYGIPTNFILYIKLSQERIFKIEKKISGVFVNGDKKILPLVFGPRNVPV